MSPPPRASYFRAGCALIVGVLFPYTLLFLLLLALLRFVFHIL
jgi:hypothetical protein